MQKHYLKTNSHLINFILRLLDLAIIVLAANLAFMWKFSTRYSVMHTHYQVAVLIGCIVGFLVFSAMNLYDRMRGRSLWSLFRRVLVSWLVLTIILSVFTFFTKTGASYSREWFFVWMLIGFVVSFAYRWLLILGLRFFRRRGLNLRHIVIIGSGKLAEESIRKIQADESAGYSICDVFGPVSATSETELAGLKVNPLPDDLERYVNESNLDEVWIALPLKKEKMITELLHKLRFSTANIHLVPDILGLELLNNSVFEISGLPVLQVRATPMQGVSRIVKSIEDKILASIILICISPILLFLAIGVKLSSPGPVFFRQERISWNNKPFDMLKFRSMPVNVESNSGAVWAKAGENRATKFGAFMRKTSLDELPQFINVLKGDMSIVGPRPERPVFVDKFKDEIPGYMYKHMMKAGITGWAQVNGWRGDTDLSKRIEYDLYYIENWSLGLDLKIIFLTIFKGFVNKNAY